MKETTFNWQHEGWPKASVDRRVLEDELNAFKEAFIRVKAAMQKPQNPNAIMAALVDEAMKTSAIEGVRVDESVVMSSICKALGMTNVPFLTETLNDFVSAAQFVVAKGEYLAHYESVFSERAKKVIVRMFRDGSAGVAAGLSVAKWIRMTKVSKPTATRDLEELVKTGAIIREGASVATRYRLNLVLHEPIDEPLEPINDPLNEPIYEPLYDPIKTELLRLVVQTPGINRQELARQIEKSVETVKRAIAALIAAGKIEHRGSKKTGGYYAIEEAQG